MIKFFKELQKFILDVSKDERIPQQDKKVIIALVALVLSPFDLIPDWIPFFGILDDVIIISIILDYFFSVLDSEILLSHFPWPMKAYTRVRSCARLMRVFVPVFIKKKLWKYVGSPF